MAKEDSRNERLLGQLGVVQEIVWIAMPDWSIPPATRVQLPVGVSWRGDQCYAKHIDGTAISVIAGGVSTMPRKADVEAAGRRLLEEAIAERAAAVERAKHAHEAAVLAAEREIERQRLADIAARVEAKEHVGLDELRDLAARRAPL